MKSFWLTLTLPLYLLAAPRNSLYQINTYAAQLAGLNQPLKSLSSLGEMGDFGLGTLSERAQFFILYNGEFYLAQEDGSIQNAEGKEMASFAQITQFAEIKHFDLSAASSLDQLSTTLLPHLENWNVPYAIVITGTFNFLKLAARNVKIDKGSEMRNVTGSLVGFWIPTALNHLAPSGFRFHFISQDRKKGGHVLEAAPARGVCTLAPLYHFNLEFPQTREFATTRFK